MNSAVTIDSREYVFPIFSMAGDASSINSEGRRFLGTGFFVSKKGSAVTAAHVLPEILEEGRRLVAIVIVDGKETVCWINYAAKIANFDFALFKVNLPLTKYFPISDMEVLIGTDVQTLGVSEHETCEPGRKQMRMFKGYVVTRADDRLELNFPVPAGMSGSPLLVNGVAVGYATGRVSSEEIEEATEETEIVSNDKEIVRISVLRRMTYYGLASPFSALSNTPFQVFNDQTLKELIATENA